MKGLFLLTDYPAITVRPGTTTTINLRLRNYALPPERYALSVDGVPQGWTVTLLGGGQPVAAAMVATNDSTSLQLRLDVPENAAMGTTQNLTVTAKGASDRGDAADRGHARQGPAGQAHAQAAASVAARHLEVELRIPDRDQERQRPQSRDQPSARRRRRISRRASPSSTAARSCRSIPIDAGQSKTVKLKVRPPSTIGANRYPVIGEGLGRGRHRRSHGCAGDHRPAAAHASPAATACCRGRAEAGKETTIPIVVTNTGTAPADEIELSSSAPSGWKIEFEPKTHRPHRARHRTRKSRCG